MQIVIVEDDPIIAELIEFNLQNEGYSTLVFHEGQSMIDALPQLEQASLFMLDIMLPGKDGFEICKILKSNPVFDLTPVIFLTARGSEADKVRGLTIGADDYIVKPFRIGELLARVEALLRRYGKIISREYTQSQSRSDLNCTKKMKF